MALKDKKLFYRLILLGAAGCGKTSILNRFLLKKFEQKYKPTVEDLFSKDFDLNCVELSVEFLDTSGSLQFPAMRQISIANANAFLLVYSVVDENSFRVVQTLIDEIFEHRAHDINKVPIVIAGNKCDLVANSFRCSSAFNVSTSANSSARNSPVVGSAPVNNNNSNDGKSVSPTLMEKKVDIDKVQHYLYCELQCNLNVKLIECSCKENINIDAIFRSYLSLAKVNVVPGYISAPHGKSIGSRMRSSFGSAMSNRIHQTTGCKQAADSKNLTPPIYSSPKSPDALNTNNSSSKSSNNNYNHFNYNFDAADSGACCSSSNNSPTTPTRDARWPSLKRKVALRVRKSCDASFISSIKNSFVDPIFQVSSTATTVGLSSANNSPVSSNNKIHNQQLRPLKQDYQVSGMRPKSAAGNLEANLNIGHRLGMINDQRLRLDRDNKHQYQDYNSDSYHDNGDKFDCSDAAGDSESRQVNLHTAIKNELIKKGEFCSKEDKIKPRSRSLIWRSTRRANKDVDIGECLTT